MDQEQRSLRLGAAVIVCAIMLRLINSSAAPPVIPILNQPEAASFLVYLETGRIVRTDSPPAESPPLLPAGEADVPAAATEPASTAADVPQFTVQDADDLSMTYSASYRPDPQALLLSPLSWDLRGKEPTVLILHTHATESYTPEPGLEYEQSADYHTLDERCNMLRVGDVLAEVLEEGGLTVLHDRTIHDYPSYSGSYDSAEETVEAILAEYPTISLVLDIHRDAVETEDGQLGTTVTTESGEAAQIMMLMGCDEYNEFPFWRDSLAIALKLCAQAQRIAPGICRSVELSAMRYNEQLCPGFLLVEIGAAGNTLSEALTSARILGNAILALSEGANLTIDSTS